MKILIDAFGGDYAPLEVIKGARLAKDEIDVEIALVGDTEKINDCAKENNVDISDMEIVYAKDILSMHDSPKEVLKSKKESSMAVGLKNLAEGYGDAFISAGSTGGLIYGSSLIVKRIKGIKRAAFGSFIPTVNGKDFFLMDEGANVDCRPEMLCQFGIMASTYLTCVTGKQNPTVGLLNIGVEDTKGGSLQLEAYKLLKESGVNFIGNVEARDLMNGVCDIVVTDGFSGNICLKTIEGTATSVMKMVKGAFLKNLKTKIGALCVKSEVGSLKSMMSTEKVGGAPVIGVRKVVIKAHGNSNALAIKNAVVRAKLCVDTELVEKLTEKLVKKDKDE